MSRPPMKAIEQIKSYCGRTQCRFCVFGRREQRFTSDLDFVYCRLQETTPCDWETAGIKTDEGDENGQDN